MQAFLDAIQALFQTLKDNWSGIAAFFLQYEERKIDSAKQAQKTAELQLEEAQNEAAIRKKYDGLDDNTVISEIVSPVVSKPDSDPTDKP